MLEIEKIATMSSYDTAIQFQFLQLRRQYLQVKHKIVNCENTDSVTSHDLYPPVTNCHTFSRPLPPWSVTYFMDVPLAL